MELFSKELQILDENTVRYMIDVMQEEIDSLGTEVTKKREEIFQKDEKLTQQREELFQKDEELTKSKSQIDELNAKIKEPERRLQDKKNRE